MFGLYRGWYVGMSGGYICQVEGVSGIACFLVLPFSVYLNH